MIARKIPRTRQPPEGTPLNRAIAPSILRAYGIGGRELVTETAASEPVARGVTREGVSQKFPGGSTRAKCANILVLATGYSTLTVLVPGFSSASNARQGIWHTQAAEGVIQNRLRMIWLSAADGFYLDTNGGYAFKHLPTFAAGDTVVLGYSRSGGTAALNPFYINGVKKIPVLVVNSSDTGIPGAASPMFLGADVESAGRGMVGDILLHVHFNRVLTDNEFLYYSENPSQLFAPQTLRIPTSVAATSGGFKAAWAVPRTKIIGSGVR